MTDRVEVKSIAQVALDSFIRFEETDDQGKFHYTGKVIKLLKDSKYFEMQCKEGLFGFFISDKNKLYIDDKPSGWDKFEKDPTAYFKKQTEEKEEQNQIKATLKERVFKFVQDHPNLDNEKLAKKCKKEVEGDEKMVAMFVKVAIMHRSRKENVSA